MKKAVSILLVCTLLISIETVSIFADTVIDSNRNVYDRTYFYGSTLSSGVDFYYSCQSFQPFATRWDRDEALTLTMDYEATQLYLLNWKLTNNTDNTAKWQNPYIELMLNCPALSPVNGVDFNIGYEIVDFSNSINFCEIGTSGHLWIAPSPDFMYGNAIVVPPHSQVAGYVVLARNYSWIASGSNLINFAVSYVDCPISSVNVYQPSSTYFSFDNTIQINSTVYNIQSIDNEVENISSLLSTINSNIDEFDINQASRYTALVTWIQGIIQRQDTANNNLSSINSNVQSILDQYTANSQNAQNLTSATQSTDQTISNIATNEDTWFTQNDQALQATGITNFNYTPTVMSGMSVISDQFTRLWLAIGDWNFVYTFSMMIGLVMLILRHNPQRKKSSSSGSGGGKSNATSS